MLRRLSPFTAAVLRVALPEFRQQGQASTYFVPVDQQPKMLVSNRVVLDPEIAETYGLNDPTAGASVMEVEQRVEFGLLGPQVLHSWLMLSALEWKIAPPLGTRVYDPMSCTLVLTPEQVLTQPEYWWKTTRYTANVVGQCIALTFMEPATQMVRFAGPVGAELKNMLKKEAQ